MIISEWHKLNNSNRFEVWLSRLPGELDAAYWINWMPNMTFDISGILLQRFARHMINYIADMHILLVTEHLSAENNKITVQI